MVGLERKAMVERLVGVTFNTEKDQARGSGITRTSTRFECYCEHRRWLRFAVPTLLSLVLLYHFGQLTNASPKLFNNIIHLHHSKR